MTSRKNKPSFSKVFLGGKKRKVLVTRILGAQDFRYAASDTVVYFSVCSLALAMACCPRLVLCLISLLRSRFELAVYSLPSTRQKAPQALNYKVSETLQKLLFCRSWFLFFFFWTFHPHLVWSIKLFFI